MRQSIPTRARLAEAHGVAVTEEPKMIWEGIIPQCPPPRGSIKHRIASASAKVWKSDERVYWHTRIANGFDTVPAELNGVMLAGSKCVCVRTDVRPSRSIRFCTANKRPDLEAPVFTHVWILTGYVRTPIFVEIVNVLDLLYKGQIWKSSSLGNSKVIISQTATNMTTLLLPTNRKCHMAFRLAYLHLTLGHSQGQGQSHFNWE